MTFKEYIKNNPADLDITSLDLSSKDLDDIHGIEVFTKLVQLNMPYNNIVDINPLYKLVNLERLNISDNSIINLDVIIKLDKLTHLSIERCFMLSKNYSDYIKLYWISDISGNNYLSKLKNELKYERRKRIISEL